jgi:DNA topoisomerase II
VTSLGQLLTSSNYDDNQKKVTGGRNGYGAKLANIFSTEFTVETASSAKKQRYRQKFRDNMSKTEQPKITDDNNAFDFTCITFKPDFKRFHMQGLESDIIALFTKRAYDLAGVTNRSVQVKLNGKTLAIKDFRDYVDLYLQTEEHKELPKICEQKSERWEVICSLSDGQFQQVSFVNSICTSKGGTHVAYISDQIVSKLHEKIIKKNKKLNIKPHQIKANLWVFVSCLIENPAFDSQTKETLNTKSSNFGSTYDLSEKFLKEVEQSGVVDLILKVAEAKELAKMAKDLGPGKKKSKLLGIPKLEDANLAGTRQSHECTIILTEGDSAKSLAMAGIEVIGRDKYGCFPLRGKFLNVREAVSKQIGENPEIQNLCKIIGLQIGKKYDDVSSLRYGSIMIMTD